MAGAKPPWPKSKKVAPTPRWLLWLADEFKETYPWLDVLKASAPSRIVNVSSGDHSNGTIDFDDLQGEKGYKGAKAYSQSKLATVLFTHELARRLEGTGVSANCLHPGVVGTNLGSGVSGSWGSR